MTDVIPKILVRGIHVLADHTVRIDRIEQFFRDDVLIGTAEPTLQTISPGDDLTALALEPVVLRVIEATWSQEAFDDMAERLKVRADLALDEARRHMEARAAEQQKLIDAVEERAAGLKRSHEIVNEEHISLDQEHAVLATRMDQITVARSALFDHMETVKATHTALHETVAKFRASLPVQPTLPPKRPG